MMISAVLLESEYNIVGWLYIYIPSSVVYWPLGDGTGRQFLYTQ